MSAWLLTSSELRTNVVWAFLERMGIEWCASRALLEAERGVIVDPAYLERRTPLRVGHRFFERLLVPLGFRENETFAPALPPGYLFGCCAEADSAEENLRVALALLEPELGPGRDTSTSNTSARSWQSGAASVTATVWPPRLAPAPLCNPAHEREPRLAAACHIAIATGYCPSLTPDEAAAVRTLAPLLASSPSAPAAISEYDAEYTRLHAPGLSLLDSHVGFSAGSTHLVWGSPTRFKIVESGAIERVEIERLLPGRGGGSAVMSLVVRTAIRTCPKKTLTLATRTRANDFDDEAEMLEKRLRVPIHLGAYHDAD